MRTLTRCLLYISAPLLTACAPPHLPFTYAVEVQQGTIIDEENVDRLQIGMTRRQVEFLMGSPALRGPFHNDRWDYIYTLEQDHQRVKYERITVFFEGDRVSNIERVPPQG